MKLKCAYIVIFYMTKMVFSVSVVPLRSAKIPFFEDRLNPTEDGLAEILVLRTAFVRLYKLCHPAIVAVYL